MNKFLKIVCMATLILIGPSQFALADMKDHDRLVSERTHNFGTIKQGDTITHVFVIRNNGSTPLKPMRMELSQQGMTARVKPVIHPGEEGQIMVRWNTRRVKGEVSGKVIIHTDDLAEGPIVLHLKGLVKPPFEFVPSHAFFLSVFKGEGMEQTITMINNEARPLSIVRLEPHGQHFQARFYSIEPGKIYQIVVKVPPETMPGRYRETLDIYTDHAEHAWIKMAVNVMVKTEIYTFPDIIDFGRVRLADISRIPLSQILLIKKREGDFEIKSIASDPALFHINQEPAGRSGTFRIEIGLNRNKVTLGELTGSLHIRTDNTDFPEVVIPVRGEVR